MIAKNGRQFFLVLCLLSVIAVWSQDNKGVRQHQELLFEGQVLCPGAAAEAYRKDYLWNLFRYRFDDIY